MKKKCFLVLFLILSFFISSYILNLGLLSINTLGKINHDLNTEIKSSQSNNYALEFDGVDDYILVSHDDSLNFIYEFTIACWINVGPSANHQGIIDKKGESSGYTFLVQKQSEGNDLECYINNDWGSEGVYSNTAVADNTWHYVAFTFNQGIASVFVDGILENSVNTTYNSVNINSEDIGIGRCSPWYGEAYWINGKMDDIRLYNRELSSTEINNIMNNNPTSNGLVLLFNFEQISNNTCYDQSGNNNHGTIYGAIETTDTPPLNNGIYDNDNDGLSDYDELNLYLTDPNDNDTDNDLLSDYDEIFVYSTAPNNPDTDGDGIDDGAEVAAGTDPNSPPSSNEFGLDIIIVSIIVIVVIILGCCSIFLYLHLTKDKRERAKQEKIERIERKMTEREIFTKKQQELRGRRAIEERERMQKERLERERLNREYLEKEKRQILIKEKEILEKVRRMMEVSTRIELEMMRNALNLDKKTFDSKIFDWAHEFDFEIDGKYLNIKKETVSDFIDELDKQFDTWRKEEEERSRKI